MNLSPTHDVLLFFEDYDRDTFFRNDRRVRRIARRLYHRVQHGKPKTTGFEVWFLLLKTALQRAGKRVHVNARRLAAQNPSFPIGICGYPHILEGWSLPNPAVLGPGLLDHPSLAPDLMKDPRFRRYVTTCDWNHRLFARVFGEERCVHWHAGIDTEHWPDLAGHQKDIDVLIYDKIRWDRERLVPNMLTPMREYLRARGMSDVVLRYGKYDHEEYRALLARARTLFFLCEHETQGMAYQEAMASNLPILAWDPGVWMDPHAKRYDSDPIAACSVPFFDEHCGERFVDFAGFEAAFERFWQRRNEYAPRAFVRECLSLQGSAESYLAHLAAAASGV
jgi:hypothetical protein